jgi:hypothetical protein
MIFLPQEEGPGKLLVYFQCRHKELGAQTFKVRRILRLYLKQRACLPVPCFFVSLGRQQNAWYPPASLRAVFFTHSANSNDRLFWKHLADTIRRKGFISSVGKPSPVKLTC